MRPKKKNLQYVLAASSNNLVLLKLKIVFILCLCSFFKEQGIDRHEPQQLQYQRWVLTTFCFQFIIVFLHG